VQIKAAHGIRTLDALLEVMELGVTRVGATQTAAMLDDFRARKAASPPAVQATSPQVGRSVS
jgi:deoxyribose-phosphate aldolase